MWTISYRIAALRESVFRKPSKADLSELHQFASDARSTVQDWLSSHTPADLDRRRHTTVGELDVGQMLEIHIVWHTNAHCGEISALKGCQGLKGYPW